MYELPLFLFAEHTEPCYVPTQSNSEDMALLNPSALFFVCVLAMLSGASALRIGAMGRLAGSTAKLARASSTLKMANPKVFFDIDIGGKPAGKVGN